MINFNDQCRKQLLRALAEGNDRNAVAALERALDRVEFLAAVLTATESVLQEEDKRLAKEAIQ